MSRKLDTTTFNKALAEKLEKLKGLVDRHITPENISTFSPMFLKKVNGLLSSTYQWSDYSNINGIEVDKLNKMIMYLKSGKTEVVALLTDQVYVEDEHFEWSIDVPEGFDGRRAILIPGRGASPARGATMDAEVLVKSHIFYNKTNIKIETKGFVNFYMHYYVFLWRYR